MHPSLDILAFNDVILGLSLLYSCWYLHLEWDNFVTCRQPIHKWLIVSYSIILFFRGAHTIGTYSSYGSGIGEAAVGDLESRAGAGFLLDLRTKNVMVKALIYINWLALVPALILWTMLGWNWLWQIWVWSPNCMPTDMHFWFVLGWLILCFASVFDHLALGIASWVLERRVQRAEHDLRQLEDPDVLSRWGHVSRLTGIRSLTSLPENRRGLTPAEIQELHGAASFVCSAMPGDSTLMAEPTECSICIGDMRSGDCIRKLDCGHVFHRACVDLWLLRSAECPLCKRSARARMGV